MFHPTWESFVEAQIRSSTPEFKRHFRPFRRELLRTAIMERLISEIQDSLVKHLEDNAKDAEALFDARGLVGTSLLWNMARWWLQNDKRRFDAMLTSRERRARKCFDAYLEAESRDDGHFRRVMRYEWTRPEVFNGIVNPHEDVENEGNYEAHWALAVADGHWS
jgi:hypothetical protein